MNLHAITRQAAHEVLWEFGRATEGAGHPPGGFHCRLIAAIVAADDINRARLNVAFPEYVNAVELIRNRKDGYERLIEIARSGKAKLS